MTRRIILILSALLSLACGATPSSAQFPDQRTWGGTSGGSANAQTLTISNYTYALGLGVEICWLPGGTNTSATTLNINAQGNKNIFKPTAAGAAALSGGELIASPVAQIVCAKYDGTQFQITSNTNASATQVVTSPQGYITPCPAATPPTGCTAGQMSPTGDVTVGVGQTVTGIVYSPAFGPQLPIYNGSNMVMTTFTELTLTMSSSHLANTIYDVCVFNNSGSPQVATGPAWTTSTAGSGARGTGAGTAQIAQVQGIWTNAVSITGLNGASTFSIAANRCTVVGSIVVSGSNGVLTFTRTFGQSRIWPVSNIYNRQPITLLAGDSTTSWTYGTGTTRASNGNSANKATSFSSLPDQQIEAVFNQNVISASGAGTQVIGIGLNVTNAFCQFAGGQNTGSAGIPMTGRCIAPPSAGINNFQQLENGGGVTASTFAGTNAGMVLTVKQGG